MKIITTIDQHSECVREHYSIKTFQDKTGLELKQLREYADKEKISILGTEISISDFLANKGIVCSKYLIVELL